MQGVYLQVADVFFLINTIQDYPWGSRTAIAELLGQPSPADQPQAELWMGTHPKAPSRVLLADGEQSSLADLIDRDPAGILGARVAKRFCGRLPFLFKVLAAAQPLSIQAHPSLEQARAGFRRENARGIRLDDYRRNYRDDNHKPEVLSALGPFWAMNGFRPIPEMLDLLAAVDLSGIGKHLTAFAADPSSEGLKEFFASLMDSEPQIRKRLISEALNWARLQLKQADAELLRRDPQLSIPRWMLRLAELYPGDIGVLSPLLLNLVYLREGDTMFLEAGVLHAYLEGTGIELMANSDNVIRGGLTPKHVDVPQLLSILHFEGRALRLAEASGTFPGQRIFQTAAEEFCLAEIRTDPDHPYRSPGSGCIELLLALEGAGTIETAGTHPLNKGDTLAVPASTGAYTIRGSLRVYKASVPS